MTPKKTWTERQQSWHKKHEERIAKAIMSPPVKSTILSAIPPHVPVVVSAVLPTDQSATGHKRNARIADLNEGLARLCAARGRCYWVDSAAKLVDAAGNLDLRYHDGDGVHLSQAGYAVWMADLRTALAAAAL